MSHKAGHNKYGDAYFVRSADLADLPLSRAMTPLSKALEDSGKSASELARFLGTSRQNVSRWAIGGKVKGGANIPREMAKKAAPFLGVTAEYLVLGQPLIGSFDPDEHEPDATGVDRQDLPPGIADGVGATVLVPKGGVVEVDIEPGLGGGGLATETYVRTPDGNQFPADAVRGVWQLPDHVFTQMRSRSQNVRCFPVQGDSMLDTLDEGDFVFVDVAHRVPSPPGIYALDDGFGGIIVKRLEVVDEEEGEPIVRVISDNDRYAERRERADSLRIVGRYVAMFTMRNRR